MGTDNLGYVLFKIEDHLAINLSDYNRGEYA